MPDSSKGDGACMAGIVSAVGLTLWFMLRHPVLTFRTMRDHSA